MDRTYTSVRIRTGFHRVPVPLTRHARVQFTGCCMSLALINDSICPRLQLGCPRTLMSDDRTIHVHVGRPGPARHRSTKARPTKARPTKAHI
jgi:hypothetical protein